MNELKPCPFCGGAPKLHRQEMDGMEHIWIQCQDCGASSRIFTAKVGTVPPRAKATDYYFTKVLAAWNRRVTDVNTD